MMAKSHRFAALLQQDGGTAAIEFALVLVVLLSVLFGIVAFGFQFAARIALSYAVAEGGRAAVAGLTSAERQSRASGAVSGVLTSFSPLIEPAKASIQISSGGATAQGETILIAIRYTDTRFNVFPFLPNLAASATVRTTFLIADPSG